MSQTVWVVAIKADKQWLYELDYHAPMTVADALALSGIREQIGEIDPNAVGIFSQKVSLETLLVAGDRVEVYQPLQINPKDIRRKRAAQNPIGVSKQGNRLKP